MDIFSILVLCFLGLILYNYFFGKSSLNKLDEQAKLLAGEIKNEYEDTDIPGYPSD